MLPLGAMWMSVQPQTMLMPTGHIASREICVLGCLQGPCLGPQSYCSWEPCLWSVLSLEAIWRPMIRAPTYCKEQGGCFCCDLDECRCTDEREGHGRTCDNRYPHPPQPPESNSLERKPLKRTLKRCYGDAEV